MPTEKNCGFHLEADFVVFIIHVRTIALSSSLLTDVPALWNGVVAAQTADKWVFAFVSDICEYRTVERQLQLHMLC